MGSLTRRYQNKAAQAYEQRQLAQFDELYQTKAAEPVSAAPAVSKQPERGTMGNIAAGSWHGGKKAVYELFNSLDELSTWTGKTLHLSDGTERHAFGNLLEKTTGIKQSLKDDVAPTTTDLIQGKKEHDHGTAYNVASSITQFVTAFIPVSRAAGALTKGSKVLQAGAKALGKAKPIVSGAVTGGVTSAVAFDPYETRLSNLVETVPSLKNPITEYLQASPDDSKATARLKNGLENSLMGIGVDLSLAGLKGLYHSVKAFKAAKTLKDAGGAGSEALQAAQEVMARESKVIRDLQPMTEVDAAVQPKAATQVVDPAAPYVGATEVDASVKPKAVDPVVNPEVLPEAAPTESTTPLTPADIDQRLTEATKQGRITALSKLEPGRSIDDITREVDSQLSQAADMRADGMEIEVIPGYKPKATSIDDARLPKTGSLDIPELLPKWADEGVTAETHTGLVDPQGQPLGIDTLPVTDELLLPPTLQRIAAENNTSVHGLVDSMGKLLGNQQGSASMGVVAPLGSTSAGAASGLFVDYNGDGKVGSWDDLSLGMLIGGAGYVSAKTLRGFLNGSTEEKALASTEIRNQLEQQIKDFTNMEEAYVNTLKGNLTSETKSKVEASLKVIRMSRDALVKYGDDPAKLDPVLNKAWVRERYKPLVKIPEGKAEALVTALRNGSISEVSTAVGKDFNLSGIKAPEDLKEALDSLTNLISEHIPEETAKATRGVVSWEQTVAGAHELGVNLHNVNMLSQDTRKLGERLLAARVAMNSIKTPLVELTDQILTNPEPPAELLLKFKELTSLAAAVQAQVKGSQTEVARALNSMKIAADTVRMDFDSVTRMLDQQGGSRQMVSAVQKLKDIMKEGDQVQVNRYIRGLAQNPSLRFLNELHRTVLLSNPVTHVSNMSGNMLTSILNTVEVAAEGVMSGRGTGDIKAVLEGLTQADTWRDALRFAKRAWTSSQSTIDPLISKVDGLDLGHGITYATFKETWFGSGVDYLATAMGMDGALGKGVDATGKLLRTTFDALGAEDEFFKVLNYRASLHREAYLEAHRIAVGEGLTGDTLAKRIGQLKAELVDTPSEALFEKALHTTRVNTFTDNPGGMLGGMNTFVAQHPTLQLFIPFTKTPTNLINYVLDRVPGASALYKQEIRDVLKNGTREQRAELGARWAAGGMLMMTAYGMAASGIITGGEAKGMSSKQVSGWQPYSVKVGDTYYAFNRLDPISSFLGLAADFHDIQKYAMDDEDTAKAAAAAMIAVTRNITSKTMLKGFTELLDALSRGDANMTTFVKNYGLSWVPAGVGAAEKALDPVVRDSVTYMDQIKAKIPGLSATLPPRRDVFGEPLVHEGALGPDILSPIQVSKDKGDPARQLFSDLGVDTKRDLKSMEHIDGVALTADQHSRFVEMRGKLLKTAVDRLVGNESFNNLPSKNDVQSKEKIISAIMGKTKHSARAKLLQEHPELMDAVRSRRTEQVEALRQ